MDDERLKSLVALIEDTIDENKKRAPKSMDAASSAVQLLALRAILLELTSLRAQLSK